ncbi:MAG: prephenate dehydratase [Opitutales bacterium]|nr:prephenate dehydratase [Opitutales bacterium]
MKTIEETRKEIEAIDSQIVTLLAQRQACAKVIGENKMQAGTNVFVPDREEQLLKKLEAQAAALKIPCMNIRAVYREIISASVALQMQKTVAYLGPAGTFTHQAALKIFGSSVDLSAMHTVGEALSALQAGKVAYAVLPIENSSAGTVAEVLDLLAETDLQIVAQTQMKIEQCLICRGRLEDIHAVYSKDVAISQCTEWLRHNLPRAELFNTPSTAVAVKYAMENPNAAAIASRVAAEINGVPVLEYGIQNLEENVTRFIVVATQKNRPCENCSEKTTLSVLVKNEVGTLLHILQPFEKNGINVEGLTSRPVPGRKWEYRFFLDFFAAWDDERFQKALKELEPDVVSIKCLGSYPTV